MNSTFSFLRQFFLCVTILSLFSVSAPALFGKTAFPVTENHNDWKEQDEFHEVMAQTFHPMEKGNLEPIRKRAGELAAKAKTWSKSKPPKALDTPKIKDTLKKLANESAALSKMVSKKASNEDIKKALTALHDRFHEVVGLCGDSH